MSWRGPAPTGGDRLRWILCGKNDAAVECLDLLCGRGDDVWAIASAGDDGRDGWQQSLRAAAEQRRIPLEQPRSINDPDFVERLGAFGARALVSIQYDQILQGPLLRTVGCPCFNLHFSLLPRHRGVAPIAWAILEGDAEAGVTVHQMIEDIDAGDVIAQRAVPIGPDTTARQLYDRVSAVVVALFEECYPFDGELLRRPLPQDPELACYHRRGDFDFSRRRIDWARPAVEVHRWIRAMIFPPMQYPETLAADRVLAVTELAGELGNEVNAEPGTVIGSSDTYLDVATANRSLRIRGLTDSREPGRSMGELLQAIRVGDRLR